MATEVTREDNEQVTNSQFGRVLYDQTPGLKSAPPLSSEVFPRSSVESNNAEAGSCYTLASDDSRYNDETRRASSTTEDTGVQNSSVAVVQRATLAPSNSLDRSGMMYVMAMLMPLVSVNTLDFEWRCTPSAIIHASEVILDQLSRFIVRLRAYVQRLAHDQLARDLFATAMDIVLVIYAIGFLFLSLYQASIFA